MRIPFQINSGGKDVLGVMHIPNRQNDIPVVIIMCYGLNGNRTEQHRSMDRNPSDPVKLKIHQKYKKPYKPLFGVCLNTGLIKEIERDNSVSKLSNLGRTLFVFGEKDKYTKHIRAYFESRNLINTNIVIIEGAGHLFNSPAYERQVNESTIKWILEDSGQ